MKTPEEMAIDYCEPILSDDYARAIGREDWIGIRCVFVGQGHEMYKAFLAGYRAAKDETNFPTPAKWISVKDRLPEDGQTCLYAIYIPKKNEWKLDYGEWQAEEEVFYGEYLDYKDLNWTVTHWMPLPAPPKEDK